MSTEQRITARDLLDVLVEADALEVFNRLPETAQDDLARWIGTARDDESHWLRIQALVAAMKSSPLNTAPTSTESVTSLAIAEPPSAVGIDDVRFSDLLAAVEDSHLLTGGLPGPADAVVSPEATLRVVCQVLASLRGSGVLDIFLRLPEAKQADFLRWIGTAAGTELRRVRTETFASALAESPLALAPTVGSAVSERDAGGGMTDVGDVVLDVARTYLEKGEEDEAVLRLLATEPHMPDSALGMHAHQAVERYLLAALSAQGVTPHKTRDLAELMAQLPSVPAHVRAAEFLTAYEVLERDPLGEVAALDRSQTLDVVNRIRGWAEEIVSSAT